MLKFGRTYLPDYALHYLDNGTNFSGYYDVESELDVAKNVWKEKVVSQVHTNLKSQKVKYGGGRNHQGIIDLDDFDDEEEYTVSSKGDLQLVCKYD